ncbi:MAG: peptide chain release factor 2 [Acidobacteria bacterium]|nr:peptide chain release factor 2 [Acidobacteriota bacterium]
METIEELERQFDQLRARTEELRSYLDPPRQQAQLVELDQKLHQPELWNDPETAQRLLQQRKHLERQIAQVEQVARDIDDAAGAFQVFREIEKTEEYKASAGDPTAEAVVAEWLAEIPQKLRKLNEDIGKLEVETLLSGSHDHRNAIVTIHSGAGGTESQDWVEMLLRMYLRWAERKGFATSITDITPGEEAGIKSVTVTLQGENAFGLLMSEIGVHRLVRISPFDAAARRHTSFASVFVTPEVDDRIEIEMRPEDLRIDTYRSSGHGGQHVNVTDSAVRVTHLPTGIVAQCQNERSQHRNKDVAMKILRSRLYQHELEKRMAAARKLEETKSDISFGSQIRSYVLHPYRLVKDHRTKLEKGDVDAVLDGEIDPFIRAYLIARRGGQVPPPYPMEDSPDSRR